MGVLRWCGVAAEVLVTQEGDQHRNCHCSTNAKNSEPQFGSLMFERRPQQLRHPPPNAPSAHSENAFVSTDAAWACVSATDKGCCFHQHQAKANALVCRTSQKSDLQHSVWGFHRVYTSLICCSRRSPAHHDDACRHNNASQAQTRRCQLVAAPAGAATRGHAGVLIRHKKGEVFVGLGTHSVSQPAAQFACTQRVVVSCQLPTTACAY